MILFLNRLFFEQLVGDKLVQTLLRLGHLVRLVFSLQRLGQSHRARWESRHALHDLERLFLLTVDYGIGESLCYFFETLLQQLCCQAVWIASQHNVHTPAGHVRGNGHRARTAGLGHDHRLLLVTLAIEHLVGNIAPLKQPRQMLRGFDSDSAHQHRLANLVQHLYLVHHSVELERLGHINHVRPVEPLEIPPPVPI